MNATEPRVSAIVVNYNGAVCLERCITSLKASAQVLEIIVVDNASTDGSAERAEANYPGIRLLRSGGNVGFGRGCNLGAAAAQGDTLLLLNYDAELEPDLAPAIERLWQERGLGILGGRLTSSQQAFQPSVGFAHTPARIVLSWLGLARLSPTGSWFQRERLDAAFYETPQSQVPWVSGALMLIRREAWEAVGGMDPGFFLYLGDVDLCERLATSGWAVGYEPSLSAVHAPRQGSAVVSRRALLSTVDACHHFTRSRRGPFIAALTLSFLGLVFAVRALVLALAHWRVAPSLESRTYAAGALRAMSWGLGSRHPWGPPC